VADSYKCAYGHFGSETTRIIFLLANELVVLLRA